MSAVAVAMPPDPDRRTVDITIEVLESLNDACLEFIEMHGLSDEFSAYLERRNSTSTH